MGARIVHPGAQAFVPPRATLTQLRAPAQRCRGCDPYKRATQAVVGEIMSPRNAAAAPRLMLVGEQPGDQEDLQGRPFVGPAGKILDPALEDAGIDRASVYLTNAVKHFKWEPAPRGKRRIHAKPSAAQVRACRPWLEKEIHLFKPDGIVILGATAEWALAGPAFKVTASRGKRVDPAADLASSLAGVALFATIDHIGAQRGGRAVRGRSGGTPSPQIGMV